MSRLTLVGHAERIKGKGLKKRAGALRVEGRRRRPPLRRDYCVNRNLDREWRMRRQ